MTDLRGSLSVATRQVHSAGVAAAVGLLQSALYLPGAGGQRRVPSAGAIFLTQPWCWPASGGSPAPRHRPCAGQPARHRAGVRERLAAADGCRRVVARRSILQCLRFEWCGVGRRSLCTCPDVGATCRGVAGDLPLAGREGAGPLARLVQLADGVAADHDLALNEETRAFRPAALRLPTLQLVG
jgi:hypothetical protein